jgi:hypothetical protein
MPMLSHLCVRWHCSDAVHIINLKLPCLLVCSLLVVLPHFRQHKST